MMVWSTTLKCRANAIRPGFPCWRQLRGVSVLESPRVEEKLGFSAFHIRVIRHQEAITFTPYRLLAGLSVRRLE